MCISKSTCVIRFVTNNIRPRLATKNKVARQKTVYYLITKDAFRFTSYISRVRASQRPIVIRIWASLLGKLGARSLVYLTFGRWPSSVFISYFMSRIHCLGRDYINLLQCWVCIRIDDQQGPTPNSKALFLNWYPPCMRNLGFQK